MALLALTPTAFTKTTPTNVTTALTALGANTGVLFPNTGREILVISTGTTATTGTSDIGITVQGQAVPGVTSGALAVSSISVLGPWASQFDRTDGSYDVEVDFSSAAGVSVALLQMVGVS